jgi:hypothetical protein
MTRSASGGDGGWQPISTAPKDGTDLLFWTGEFITCGFWPSLPHPNRTPSGWCLDFTRQDPTHWMPLPLPPPPAPHHAALSGGKE